MKNLTTKTNIGTNLAIDVRHRIIKHIKDKHGRYVATFLAIPISDSEVRVAWSKCHRLDEEKNRINRISSRKKGLQIAMNKLINGSKVPVASTLIDHMADFLNNIAKYYQDKKVIAPTGMIAEDKEVAVKTANDTPVILELLELGECDSKVSL